MDGHPPHRRLIRVPVGDQLLQLQRPPADEAESGADGPGAVDVPLPQRAQRVGVVEGDAPLLEVEAHAQPGRQRVGEACGGGGAVAVGDGVSIVVAVVAVVVVVVLGQIYFTHPHRQEAEGRG